MSPADLVVAAINAVWQTTVLALLAGVALRFVRLSAAGHAAVWSAVFFAGVLFLPLDLVFQRPVLGPGEASRTHVAVVTVRSAPATAPVVAHLGGIASATTTLGQTLAGYVSAFADRVGLPFVALWCLIAAWRLLRLVRATALMCSLKGRARALAGAPAGLDAMVASVRSCRIGVSERVDVPCAVGFLRPMVLLPRMLVERVAAEDLYATVAHEVAHLRRGDDVMQLVQRLGTALFFFNPALFIVGRRIDFYREAACDDRVISSRASALRYAECLATIVERSLLSRRSPAPALVHGRRQVSARVERLVNWKEGTRTMGRAAILIALAVCATALFFVRVEIPTLFAHDAAPRSEHDTVVVVSTNGDDETLLGALAAAGYHPTVDDAIALANAGVDSDFVVTIHRSGIERPAISDLVALANAGVDGDLVTAAVRAFGQAVTASDLVRLQNAGVDSGDLADYRSSESRDLSVTDIIALHDAGVDADYLRHVSRIGRDHLSVRDIIRLHEAGVDS
jgi:beta-lactamase regulating signal transducer with metallopeptidase domain